MIVMRSLWLLVLALSLAAPRLAAQGALRFEPLFDGATLAGWSGDARYWSVEDGVIVGRATAEVPCKRNTFLVHDGTFGDFELRFSYRILAGNSGVQYRSELRPEFVVAGYQADIEAGPTYTGILYEERGRGILARRGERVRIGTDGKRSAEPALGDGAAMQAQIRADWNDYVVRAVGNRLTHTINGMTTIEVVDDGPEAKRSGKIAIQVHAGPPMEVQYKDLRIAQIGVEARPEWIWGSETEGEGAQITLRRGFELTEPAAKVEVHATCDNEFVLFLDGNRILAGKDWAKLQHRKQAGPLAAGQHTLVARCVNEGGPAGFLLRARVTTESGATFDIVSDPEWRVGPADAVDAAKDSGFDASAWPQARSFGPSAESSGPWPDPFAPREATPAEKLVVADGFRVQRMRSAQIGEGSWIAVGLDEQGELLVSIEGGHLARVLDPEREDGGLLVLTESPTGCMGFCAAYGALYVQGNGSDGYGLYRMRDADRDGRYEEVTRLHALGGGGEHGAHAVRLGPDGRIYVMNGNMSPRPESLAKSSPHKDWAEDVLLPRLVDPRGHAREVRAPGGHVLRTGADGKTFEIYAAGFRNAYDFAFGPDGEIFTFDSDMEWDIGLPWYRPTRIIHAVSGGESGWRTGASKWPVEFPDSLPAVVDVGLSSPTGVEMGYGFAFPDVDRRALYAADWAYGRILRVRLEPDGATFTGSFDHFVTGKPLNVTDLTAGPDGALWFTTGGRGTQAGLYRVTWNGDAAVEGTEMASLQAEARGADVRAQRRAFEALHGRPDNQSVGRVFEGLGHGDRFVRYAARIALEFLPPGLWADRAIAETPGTSALEALLALARQGDDADRDAVLERLGAFRWQDLDRGQRAAWLRVHEVAQARRTAPVGDDLRLSMLIRLSGLYPCGDRLLDRQMLQLLVAGGGAGPAVGKSLDLLEQMEVGPGIQVAYALRLVGEADWSAEDRERLFRWLGAAKNSDGGASFRGYIEAIERDALERSPESAREALKAMAAPPLVAIPDLQALGNGARAWTMQELQPYLAQVGKDRDFARGEAAFTKAACAACHRFDGKGGGVGPDLTAASSRFSRRDLLQTILEPSADISDQYENTMVTLRNGSVVVGRIVDEAGGKLDIIVEPFTGQRQQVAVADVESRVASPVSPMPAGLLGALTLEEVLDLLAYLESGGNRSHPAFR
ncbi:MAG: DUF1080 domain-containing protein [Planctomycetota bacterium]|nr:DUF1080 domain-containing protein [Planctomycetota bacterium]